VALFNILQEGDVQIRGFKLRLPLDIQFVFTANPEDYTNRGSIVTPLKDRIGSQILTHYPDDIETARAITLQEAEMDLMQKDHVHVPDLAMDILEEISFQARESEYIDAKSGVSARMSITAFQNLLSTAERRALLSGQEHTTARMGDFMGVIPAITGKVELVYEGEQEGAAQVAQQLIADAVKAQFDNYFPQIKKLQKESDADPYTDIVAWFFEQSDFELLDSLDDQAYQQQLDRIAPLDRLVREHMTDLDEKDRHFVKEFVLWALVEYRKLSKYNLSEGMRFKDVYGGYISDL
jgi:magnesium chelatase subunit I